MTELLWYALTNLLVAYALEKHAILDSHATRLKCQLSTSFVDTGVCEKNTPPEKKTLGKISLTKSGDGEQFLLL